MNQSQLWLDNMSEHAVGVFRTDGGVVNGSGEGLMKSPDTELAIH